MSTENTITTAAADVAAAPNATLDELVGTTTNTAILPEPDAHAYDEIATGDADANYKPNTDPNRYAYHQLPHDWLLRW